MKNFITIFFLATLLAAPLVVPALAADQPAPPSSPAAPSAPAVPPMTPVPPVARTTPDQTPPAPQPATPPLPAPGTEFDTPPILEVDPDNPFKARAPAIKPDMPVLVREGRRLFDHAGRFGRQGPETVFVFESGLAPMPVSPSKEVERAEDLTDYGRRPLVFRVSGVVSEYRKRNYLLITEPARLGEERIASPAPPPDSAYHAAPRPVQPDQADSTAPPAEPERPRDRDQPPAPSTVVIPNPPSPPPPTLVETRRPLPSGEAAGPAVQREGKWLVDQEGRLVRRGTKTVFVFDSGDPSVVLMPNQKLERMEDLADFGRKPIRFRVSGLVTEYRGANFMWLSKAVVIPKELEKL